MRSADLNPVDLWIQGASGGEAYLALEIVTSLSSQGERKILLTSGTVQGLSILKQGRFKTTGSVETAYFPFDIPHLMIHGLEYRRPKLVVLLETELWPGLMAACHKKDVPVIIVNGRMSERSLKGYLIFKSFWKEFGPERIYAISPDDAHRFGILFGPERVEEMNNIKFDRMDFGVDYRSNSTPLESIVPFHVPFLVLGSVRKEEERDIERVIEVVSSTLPGIVIGLFPRHMHRVGWWRQTLERIGIRWTLRSELQGPVSPGTTILWDRFGELNFAYAIARAVFVGGSLKPCGGQNFLEPLGHGVVPCVGPFLDNFRWVGEDIFQRGLALRVNSRKELARALLTNLVNPQPRDDVVARAEKYVQERRGGTAQACQLITTYV